MKTLIVTLAVTALAVVALPQSATAATPVSVTDTVSGGPGAYTYTFSLTNDIGGTNTLYFFGVDLSGSIVGTPASWSGAGNQNANWSNAPYGGSSTVYPNTWCCAFGGTPSGTTTTGFTVLSATSPASVKFFAFAYNGNDGNADGHFNSDGNPGFEGAVGGTVPEPALWLTMIAGFAAVGGTLRSARRVERAAA